MSTEGGQAVATPASAKGSIKRFIPILVWLPQYQRSWLTKDVIAGLSVWALMVPTSLGYASLAGVPVQNGLYAAAFGMIVFALFTTSKQLVQGPGSSTAPVLGAAVVSIGAAGSDDAVAIAAAITLVAAVVFIVMAVLKMGWIAEFLSAAVLTGFIFGVAINVVSGELFKLTGTEKSGSNTWQKLWDWAASLPDANRTTVVLGVAALVVLFGLKFLVPKVPAELVAVVLGIALTVIFGLGDRGVELIADVPRGLAAPSIPDLQIVIDNWETVIGAAVGLVLIGFSVTTAGVREYASKHNYRVDVDQELLAQGMSNVSSSVFQGFFNNGSLSKSPVNDGAGARSQVSSLAQGGFVILTLLFLAPIFSKLPEAVLGAIIIEAVTLGMMDVGEMKRLAKVKRYEFVAALAALLGVMTFGILQGVFIGVGISMIWLVAVSALPYIPELGRKPGTDAFYDLERHDDCRDDPRAEDPAVRRRAVLRQRRCARRTVSARSVSRNRRGSTAVILSMEGVNFIDTEGADVLMAIAQAGIDHGIDLHLARVKAQVIDVLERDGFFDLVDRSHVHDNIEAAVAMHQTLHPTAPPG